MIYVCSICSYQYDEDKEASLWKDLPEDWVCPVCGVGKSMFSPIETSVIQKEEADEQKQVTVSDVLVDTLQKCGLRWVFGMVGHSNLGFANALRKAVEKNKLSYIGIRHEGAAAFACSAYGKLMGKPAGCLTIAGPGATNLITGLADAMCDKSPLIAITGQIPTSTLGERAFQELDLHSIFAPIVSYSVTLAENSPVETLAITAYRNAVLKSSVAQLELPDDVQVASVKSKDANFGILTRPPFKALASDIDKAIELLKSVKKPVLILGEGARSGYASALEFAELLECPIITTYRGRGIVGDDNPLSCGLIGRSGTPVASHFVNEADCIISVGVGFSKHSAIPKGKKLIQIDSDEFALGKFYKVDCALCGDAGATLAELNKYISQIKTNWGDVRKAIDLQKNLWKSEKQKRALKNSDGAISPAAIGDILSKIIPQNAIVSLDVGNVAYWFGRYFEASAGQRFLLSWYLGSIGVGLPSAIGAWCATRELGSPHYDKPVVAVVGDGGLGQYLAEWTTVVKNNMNIKCIVINNSELAKISLEERNVKMPVWETSLTNPDFAKFSEICGGKGYKISDVSKLEEVLSLAFADNSPAIIEILTDPNAT